MSSTVSLNRHRQHIALDWHMPSGCGCGVYYADGWVALVLDPPRPNSWRLTRGPYPTLAEAQAETRELCPHR